MNYIFDLDKEKDLEHNKKAMALVTNKLLLAYKNKPKFLENLVMMSSPSLLNIYQNIVKLAKEDGYASAEVMKKHLADYIERMKNSKNVSYNPTTGVISQYGGGSMVKPGAYDRYVPFKNFPEADFLVIAWPLGLLQASCNPFKKERSLKGVNLGEIAQNVLQKFKSELQEFKTSVDTVKYFAEKHKDFDFERSVGFTYEDLLTLYGNTEGGIVGLDKIPEGAKEGYTVERWQNAIKNIMNKPYMKKIDIKTEDLTQNLSEKEIKALKMLQISGWDMIQANSGGHKCITNISGLMYFGKNGVEWLKRLQSEFENELSQNILNSNVTTPDKQNLS